MVHVNFRNTVLLIRFIKTKTQVLMHKMMAGIKLNEIRSWIKSGEFTKR
jgi:hypothetical protein